MTIIRLTHSIAISDRNIQFFFCFILYLLRPVLLFWDIIYCFSHFNTHWNVSKRIQKFRCFIEPLEFIVHPNELRWKQKKINSKLQFIFRKFKTSKISLAKNSGILFLERDWITNYNERFSLSEIQKFQRCHCPPISIDSLHSSVFFFSKFQFRSFFSEFYRWWRHCHLQLCLDKYKKKLMI